MQLWQYCLLPYFSIDNARVIYIKRSKFVKNEHARYTAVYISLGCALSIEKYGSNCKITLHVSDTFCAHHQEYKNCSNSHWCMSWVGCLLQLTTDLGRPCWIYIIPTHDMHQSVVLEVRTGYTTYIIPTHDMYQSVVLDVLTGYTTYIIPTHDMHQSVVLDVLTGYTTYIIPTHDMHQSVVLDVLTGYTTYIIPTHDMHQWLLLIFSTPDDGSRKRPKHEECSCNY